MQNAQKAYKKTYKINKYTKRGLQKMTKRNKMQLQQKKNKRKVKEKRKEKQKYLKSLKVKIFC